MAGLRQQPQGAQAPRDPVAQDEVPQTLPSLVSLRNMRNPAPGLATALVNFAHLVQHLERELSLELWSTSDAEDEQEAEQGGTSDAESEPTATPVPKHLPAPSTPPKKRCRVS